MKGQMYCALHRKRIRFGWYGGGWVEEGGYGGHGRGWVNVKVSYIFELIFCVAIMQCKGNSDARYFRYVYE